MFCISWGFSDIWLSNDCMPVKDQKKSQILITFLIWNEVFTLHYAPETFKKWLQGLTLLNLIILLPLRLYVKSNFGKFKWSKKVIFGNFRNYELWILVNLGLENCSNVVKSKFKTSKLSKLTFLDRLNSPKFDFT